VSALYSLETASLQGFTTRAAKSTNDFDYPLAGRTLGDFLAALLT